MRVRNVTRSAVQEYKVGGRVGRETLKHTSLRRNAGAHTIALTGERAWRRMGITKRTLTAEQHQSYCMDLGRSEINENFDYDLNEHLNDSLDVIK